MTDSIAHRLHDHRHLLKGMLRGIEKEGLRVDSEGQLALTPHPSALGSALTHPRITTDYSESLIELITGTHDTPEGTLAELEAIHRNVYQHLGGELIWNHSMPCHLPDEADIPIAWYGSSNSGMLRHVYRRGLAYRYGKVMQCIAGLHYNFSVPDELWALTDTPGDTPQVRRSAGYIALVRNFMRYSWLLMYLFGASPAVSRDFIRKPGAALDTLSPDTLYLPHATSLRMSGVGYQNKSQGSLKPCYNDLQTFLQRMHEAVTTPWPAYEAIGTHHNGQWIQLNTHILQIENEYYSTIRPKQTARRGERPSAALAARGVQYVEVRCLDIDPMQPAGIALETARVMDAFLLFCALNDSPMFPNAGFCGYSADNFSRVATEGRKPGLMLAREGQPVSLVDWGMQLLAQIEPYAQCLDEAFDSGTSYQQALRKQVDKIKDVSLTPSAQVLDTLQRQKISFQEHALELSRQHGQRLREQGVSVEEAQRCDAMAAESLAEQARLENADTLSFDDYVARYNACVGTQASAA